jgi:hypothetical protein
MSGARGTVTLIGSGEFGEGMGRVYREIFSHVPAAPNGVFLDTPAGFELNSDNIATRAAEYFSTRFGLVLECVTFKNKVRATAFETEAALRGVRRADFIFAGPGSPSYAVRNLEGTAVWETITSRWQHGAQVVLASAAAIAAGSMAIPVYEIFKAGAEPVLIRGLDLFAHLDMDLAIVPHWNNNEGANFDTRYCFMGEERFRELEEQLEPRTSIVGIDEHTACIFDPEKDACLVLGAGTVTVRRKGREWSYPSGESFPFHQLRAHTHSPARETSAVRAETDAAPMGETPQYLVELARALNETSEPVQARELIDHAHDTMHVLASDWLDEAHTAPHKEIAPLVGIMIEIRQKLRDAKQYSLADEIRKSLAELDIVLEDSADGTTWRKG